MRDFFAGRRVLVTGHTGFKGSWLAFWLTRLGAAVRGFSLAPPSEPNLFELAGIAGDVDDVRGDIRDLAAVSAALAGFRPEIVVHMAAQALVRRSYAEPVETFAANVLGTVHVLEAARKTPSVRAVVNVTSDKCYENREESKEFREGDPLGGRDPYSASKACAEIAGAAYARAYFSSPEGAALASARAGNVIGGGDFGADRLVPDLARAAKAGSPAPVRSPAAVRPWQHVLDPLSGYLLLARRLVEGGQRFAGAYNFGPTGAMTVAWLADGFCAALGSGARWERDSAAHPHEAGLLRLDCSKAASVLGWRPRLATPQALEWTAAWYRAWLAGQGDLRGILAEQIAAFEELCA